MPNPHQTAVPSSPTLRLILGDQHNPQHSWFASVRPEVVYVLMEMRQETDYVLHHAQKIIAIFAGMRELARQLREAGHRVHYLAIDDPANHRRLDDNLHALSCGEVVGLHRHSEPRLGFDDEASIGAAATSLSQGGKFHLIINATGMLHTGNFTPEKKLGDFSYA